MHVAVIGRGYRGPNPVGNPMPFRHAEKRPAVTPACNGGSNHG
jgi:hypothetical protein